MKIGALLKYYESGYNRYGEEKYNKIKEHGYDWMSLKRKAGKSL